MLFLLCIKVAICLFLTIISSHFLIKYTVKIAEYFSIPSYIISLTVLSFGTSIAEIVTSIQSILVTENLQMTLGNIIGSNIFNTTISYSIVLLFIKQKIQINKNDQLFSVLSLIFFIVITQFSFFNNIIAFILIGTLIFYYYQSLKNDHKTEEPQVEKKNIFLNSVLFVISLLGITYGSKFFIQYSVDFARYMQISDYIIGATIVAIGTSFPELITTIIALWNKKPEIALGNIIGSNIFNILGILGIGIPAYEWFANHNAAIININLLDIGMITICTLVIIATIYLPKFINKFLGIFLISLYCIYLFIIL